MKAKIRSLLVVVGLMLLWHAIAVGFNGTIIEKRTTDQGVAYLGGGVGVEERDWMQNLEQEYNLKLIFAGVDGKYLADIAVDIQDDNGDRVLETYVDGPWLLVNLPPGSYRITAACRGSAKSRTVLITHHLRPVFFHWAV